MKSYTYGVAVVFIILLIIKIIYNIRLSLMKKPKTIADIHDHLSRVELYMATLVILKLLSSLYNLSEYGEEKNK
jgi:hypothetical protein